MLSPVLRTLLSLLLLLASVSAVAVIEIAPLSSAELEARYRELLAELRCPKCQNQNLADSDSPIAADLREQVRVLLEEGKSDDEVVAYLVDRYGDFVRYRPAVQSNTLVLWFGPAVLGVLALLAIVLVVRAYRRPRSATPDLSEAERRRLQQLLTEREDGGSGNP